ncbi:hypothetical protein CH379_000070 [Leptospira ellisii]|uniref:Uncharacterized protein n=1 Tax=Leptospira ellisii TaxID=2023197 RepID=A0A2N0BAS0_9LEPT|nr:hypothetical protein [Leptospira ellisii]MDV6234029.1 hypothetical protein [Leptospira ellisii]PJZ93613.1 hypothetical protein CH379_06975 [Leptospira ellisii]
MMKNRLPRAIGINIVLWILFCSLTPLFTQDKQDKKAEKETPKPESSRELIETGKLESTRKRAFSSLKGIRISLLNFGKKQELEKFTADYGQAETQYLRAEYSSATSSFEQIFKSISPLEDSIRKDYESKTVQLGQEIAPIVVSIRLDEKNKYRSILPVLEKFYIRSGETSKAAVTELEKGDRTSALYYQKQSLYSLYRIKILLGKNEDLSLSDRISKNRILETDYLKPEELIYWDDTNDRVHSEAEEERKRDRVKTLKTYEWRLGISAGKLQKDSEPKTQPSSAESSVKPK